MKKETVEAQDAHKDRVEAKLEGWGIPQKLVEGEDDLKLMRMMSINSL
jgi:hypothetical protein